MKDIHFFQKEKGATNFPHNQADERQHEVISRIGLFFFCGRMIPGNQMIDEKTTFGSYLRRLRIAHGLSMRGMAAELGYSPSYYGDVERNRKAPFELETIEEIRAKLHLSESQYTELLDLAGEWKDKIAPDLVEYIQSNPRARRALRIARDHNISDEQWNEIIHLINGSEI